LNNRYGTRITNKFFKSFSFSTNTNRYNLSMTIKLEAMSREVKYEPIEKRFGSEAERLTKPEFLAAIEEIISKCRNEFPEVKPIIPLDDKETFGDVDLVIISNTSPEDSDEERMKRVFGDSLLDYRHQKNDKMDSLYLKLDSGKKIQVDFARTKNIQEFEAKLIHASKGHSSSVIGILARAYGFKFAMDGFYKRHINSNGDESDILITNDLFKAMEMLGLSPNKWKEAKTVEDIIDFIASSEIFSPSIFSTDEAKKLNHKRSASLKRRSVQRYMYARLSDKPGKETKINYEEYLEAKYPEVVQVYKRTESELVRSERNRKAINGEAIMIIFNLNPSKDVGLILKHIKSKYPDADKITPEMVNEINAEYFPEEKFP